MSLSDEARRIVDEARLAYAPSDDDRARVAASLPLQLTPTAAAGTASAAAPASLIAGKTVLGLAVLVAVGVASVGYWWTRGEGPAQPRAGSTARPASQAASPAPIAAPSAPAASAPAAAGGAPPVARRSRAAPAPHPTALKVAPPEPAPNVAGEIALLQEAQRSLATGHPDQALRLLDRHAHEFSRGSLIEERMAERIIALCALGRASTARAEAAAYVRRFPASPLVERVRAACETDLAPASAPGAEK